MIYSRYCLKELLKAFFLILFSLYFLYVLIEYSAHIKTIQSAPLRFAFSYFLFQFSKQAEVLVPFAFLIAVIKVIVSLNQRNEIVALVTSGLPLKKVVRPVMWGALFVTTLLYLNYEFISQRASKNIDFFEATYIKQRGDAEATVSHLTLPDHSLLLYQHFDPLKEQFFDLFWILNEDEIYRAKTLSIKEGHAQGEYVDHIVRQGGELIKKESFEKKTFETLKVSKKELNETKLPSKWQPLSLLIKDLFSKSSFGLKRTHDKVAESISILYYKLTLPLIPLLTVISVAPFCLTFTRKKHFFMIYAFSLFGMIAFFTLIHSSLILGQAQVIAPFWAIFLPYFLFFSIFGKKYATL